MQGRDMEQKISTAPQQRTCNQIYKSVPRKVHPTAQMNYHQAASWHFPLHAAYNISLVKNNSNLVIRRHTCRKPGQYSYLYSASLDSEVITSWVFLVFNKTHQNQCSSHTTIGTSGRQHPAHTN